MDDLIQNYLAGHKRQDQSECDAIVAWAIRVLEDSQLLHAVVEGRLLIGIEDGRIVFGAPEDVSQ